MATSVHSSGASCAIDVIVGSIKKANARVEMLERLSQNFHAAGLKRKGGHMHHKRARKVSGAIQKIGTGAWNGKVNIGINLSKLHHEAVSNNFLLIPVLRKFSE